MKFVDIFCGIGSIRLGLEQAGHECIYSIEVSPLKRRIYAAIFGEEPCAKEIRMVKDSDIPYADIWCCGFPCEDIAKENKRHQGLQGKRSGLFFHVIKLAKDKAQESRPPYLFFENVKRLLSINQGQDFCHVLYSLDELGYDVEWDVINSCQVVPQCRERLYIIGRLRGSGAARVFPLTGTSGTDISQEKSKGSFSGTVKPKWGEKQNSCTLIQIGDTVWREPTAIEAWRLQGINDDIIHKVITQLSSQGFSKKQISRQMYRGAGDACTVPVIYAIAKQFVEESGS